MPDPTAGSTRHGAAYKWYVLALGTLTHTLVVAMPMMSMPVLFAEIAAELELTLVQVGWIWGLGFLTGIVTSLLGGALTDRFGTRRVLVASCCLAGILGALRGLAGSFVSLAAATFFFGLLPPVIPMSVHKTCGLWFPRAQLGLANGMVSTGMALGFMLGSLLSATVLSPLLGGWRRVLFCYGAVSLLVGLGWACTRTTPTPPEATSQKLSLWSALANVARVRDVWLLGATMLGLSGCIQGTLGYLPLYLRRIGWPGAMADAALSAFHGASMLATIPLALLSDKLGTRRRVLLLAACTLTTGVALLALPGGTLVWPAVVVAGTVRDGMMAVLMTLIMEHRAIGTGYAGTAMGLVLLFSRLGSLLSPPLGNSLAALSPWLPFGFWAVLGMVGIGCLLRVRESS
ncbi:MAG: MFS transporter [Candidatus Tectimicrobiota bacterium]|nr:MAG: MFS transporter [Candidatus Tectomicrobia bacterium]